MHPTFRRTTAGTVLAVALAALALPAAAQSPSAPASPSVVTSPAPVASPGAAPSGYTWTTLAPPAGAEDVDVTGSSVAADGTWVALAEAQFDEEYDSWVWRIGPTDASVGRTKIPKSAGASPRSLVRLGDQLLVVGSGKTWSSSDGSAWKTAKNKLKGLRLWGSASDGTRAVILGSTDGKDDMFVLSTTDGKAFTKIPIEAPEGKRARPHSIALSPTGAVMVAAFDLDHEDQGYYDPGFLWSSPDGVTFTPVALPSGVQQADPGVQQGDSLAGLAAAPSGFILVVAPQNGPTAIYLSPDGQTWTETFTTTNRVFGYSRMTVPASSGGGLLMIGNGVLYTSPDGVTWTETPTPEFEGVQNSYVTTGAVLPDGRIVLKVEVDDDTADFGHASSVLVGTPQPKP